MARILAIDYGGKRVGIAVTDTLQLISNGLDTVPTKEIFVFLKNYFAKEAVECVVVGEPKRLNLSDSHSTEMTEKFVKEFKNRFPTMKVERMDERFTSKMAFQAMIDGGVKKKDRQNKETVDKVSATLILQSFMEHLKFINQQNKPE
ncbi:MAG: Holliday junction resolvase RuvX [Bacteroidetes bacterium]|nr:Holliday junction resolvase RuvX [Bacteroidota bacterium]